MHFFFFYVYHAESECDSHYICKWMQNIVLETSTFYEMLDVVHQNLYFAGDIVEEFYYDWDSIEAKNCVLLFCA